MLNDEWLTPPELEEKQREKTRLQKIRSSYQPSLTPSATTSIDHPLPKSDLPPPNPSAPPSPENADTSSPEETSLPAPVSEPTLPSSPAEPDISAPRRSSRNNKGTFASTRFINEVFLSSQEDPSLSQHDKEAAYLADLSSDLDLGLLNTVDHRAFAAKSKKKKDPDMPSYFEALSSPEAEEWIKAMQTEVKELLRIKTWTRMDRSAVPLGPDGKPRRILKGTWAFKLKRLPDGTPLKYKARYCVRGDLQVEGVDFFETYAPVVQWSTVRLLLTLILTNGWQTKQVDYTNAFAQAAIDEEVYIEQPKGFGHKDGIDKVLKLNKSLYGLRQAPKSFFDKLCQGLKERGWKQSVIDPCLFMKDQMMCVVYVDDTIMAGPDGAAIEEEIKGLGVAKSEHRHQFVLRDEGEVGDFLGIRIEKTGDNTFTLCQPGLIQKVLAAAGMEEANSAKTPASTTPVGMDKEGESFSEDWDYAAVIGMLMYLANNSRPDIAYAVHQCARFTHCPKKSHGIAVKRVLRYLKGTSEKGMILKPTNDFKADCYVDADFAGLWGSEDDQDPVCVKSRTGYLLTFMGCPLLWVSKLQTQIALSTMEAEYIALSQAMRDLIPLRETLKEIKEVVFGGDMEETEWSTHSKSFLTIPPSTVYEDNSACLKFATMPKMSSRTKHIAVPYHFFCSKVVELEIAVVPVDTTQQLADQFTKGLCQEKFERDRASLMGW